MSDTWLSIVGVRCPGHGRAPDALERAAMRSSGTLFHDQWITERDFQLAKAHGFNFVRIPFWYHWFESDDRPYHYHDYGFSFKAIAWAEATIFT